MKKQKISDKSVTVEVTPSTQILENDTDSWGSPSPPPSSPGYLSEGEIKLYGVDNTLFCHDEDERNGFVEREDGKN